SAQIDQINLDTILDLGYTGHDMVIAVLDAGFFGMDTATLFQSFWDKSQILGYHNFPDHNDQVFNIFSGYHGSWVLSVIGGDIDSVFSGSAPDADFYLFRTEVADSEYVVEEDYWLQAAEKADSVGADIINSSLGYTVFDDAAENHTYADLDGNTTVVTKAADMAAQKGILVCNSAGNEGGGAWHYISMPSDGDSVFSIGGVDAFGTHVGFSGYGPTSDGRIKPNVVALATGSAVLDPGGAIAFLNGTSFSSPLLAGACASLWDAFPLRTNMEIMNAVQQSASLFLTPNDSMGYGIPNFGLAFEMLKQPLDTISRDTTTYIDTTLSVIDILPNPVHDAFTVFILSHMNEPATIQISNMSGEKMFEQHIYLNKDVAESFSVSIPSDFASGIYILSLLTYHSKQSERLFVN
ncbi:MAG: S8 family serine peptidase, partial [Chitinophagales bacterium]